MGECDLWNLDLPGVLRKTPRLGSSPQVSLSQRAVGRQRAGLGYPRGLYGSEQNILFQKGVEYLNSLISLAVLLHAPPPSGLYALCLVYNELGQELHQCTCLCPVLENCWVFWRLCVCVVIGAEHGIVTQKGRGKKVQEGSHQSREAVQKYVLCFSRGNLKLVSE